MTGKIQASLIIAAYEAADFIQAAIAACLAQTETSIEIIIVDDASAHSLETAVMSAAKGDPRVRFFRLDENCGPAGARNRALIEARGDYIAVLDADDAMRPERLATMLAAAQSHGADIVVDSMIARRIDEAGGSVEEAFLNPDAIPNALEIDLETYIDPVTSKTFGQPLGYLKPLIRRQFIQDANIRYDTDLTNSEDYYFIADMLARGAKMLLLPYAGYVYTIQAGSISHRITPDQTAAIIAAEQSFQQRHKTGMSASAQRAARARLQQVKREHEFEVLIADLRRKSVFGFAGHLLARPANAPAHMLKLLAIALRRFN